MVGVFFGNVLFLSSKKLTFNMTVENGDSLIDGGSVGVVFQVVFWVASNVRERICKMN